MQVKTMNADLFATEIKNLRNVIDNSEQLCDELACRPDIAEAATELAQTLCMVAGLEIALRYPDR